MTTPVAPHPSALPSPVSQPPPAASRGLTGRLASVSARRPRRALFAWGLLILLSLGLAATSLHGLTSTSHVIGTTPSGRAEALYSRATGGSAEATAQRHRRRPCPTAAASAVHPRGRRGARPGARPVPRSSPVRRPARAR